MIDLAPPPVPVRHLAPGQSWGAIHDRHVELLIAPRMPLLAHGVLDRACDLLPRPILFDGDVDALPAAMDAVPALLAADVMALAARFADLVHTSRIRARLEVITGDACRKWHRDYTDLRLVLTYRGPGTQFRRIDGGEIEQVPEQAPALFKGRLAPGCAGTLEHRSPPIDGTGIRRLVLVLDGPMIAPAV